MKKKKFRVIGLVSASIDLGVYEAETKEEAIDMAYDNDNTNFHPTVCTHCSKEIEIGNIYDEEVYEEK